MHAFKARLLEVVGDVAPNDLPDSALVEIIIARLTKTQAELRKASDAMLRSGLQAQDAWAEIRRLRNDPLALAHGDFYFCDINPGVTYVVSVNGGRINMAKRIDRIDYCMQQISAEQFAATP